MLYALYGFNLDVGFFMAGEVDIGKDQDGLRAVGDVERAVETERLHARPAHPVWSRASLSVIVLS